MYPTPCVPRRSPIKVFTSEQAESEESIDGNTNWASGSEGGTIQTATSASTLSSFPGSTDGNGGNAATATATATATTAATATNVSDDEDDALPPNPLPLASWDRDACSDQDGGSQEPSGGELQHSAVQDVRSVTVHTHIDPIHPHTHMYIYI